MVHSFTDILYVISSIGRDSLLCASSDLLQTVDLSTPFCSFLGKIYTLAVRTYNYGTYGQGVSLIDVIDHDNVA